MRLMRIYQPGLFVSSWQRVKHALGSYVVFLQGGIMESLNSLNKLNS